MPASQNSPSAPRQELIKLLAAACFKLASNSTRFEISSRTEQSSVAFCRPKIVNVNLPKTPEQS